MSARTKTLTSPKQHPRARVQSLVRIGRRAALRADHLERLMADRSYGYETAEQRTEGRTEVERLNERTRAAARELCQIVRDNPDEGWTLPQQRAAATYEATGR